MSSIEQSRQAKIIAELRSFIKKVLADPTVAAKSMEIARQLRNEPDAERRIADEISSQTTVRIPEQMSDADKMFLEIIREVLDDEDALY